MNKIIFSLISIVFGICFLCTHTKGQDAIINEWSQGTNGKTAEWVEILVIKDGLDLTGWNVKDKNQGTNLFTFSNQLNNVPAGTLIVVYQDPATCGCSFPADYNLPPDDTELILDCNYKLQFASNSAFIASTDWSNSRAISNSRNEDNPQLFDGGGALIHDWDNGNDADFISKRPGSLQAVYFANGNLDQLLNADNWKRVSFNSAEITPGMPNNEQNESWIASLRPYSCIRFQTASSSVPENNGETIVNIEVLHPRPMDNILEINFVTGTATLGTDFTIEPNVDNNNIIQVRLPALQEIIPLKITPLMDCIIDDNETFQLLISKAPPSFYIIDFKEHQFTITDAKPEDKFQVIANPVEICQGATSELEIRYKDGREIPPLSELQFNWEPTNMLDQNISQKAKTIALTTTTTFTATITDMSGCEEKHTITVTVGDNFNLEITPEKPSICKGEKITLTASEADSYLWNPSGLTTRSIEVAPTEETLYTLTAVKDGCSNTTSVTVLIKPQPNTTLSENDITLCVNSNPKEITLSGADTYTWEPQTGITSTAADKISVNPTTSQTYTITGTQNGCTNTATLKVTVVEEVKLQFTSTPNSICNGSGTKVNITATGADSYQWTPSTGLDKDNTDKVIVSGISLTTTYTVIGILGGCSGTATVTVTVETPPVITIKGSTGVCEGNKITLTTDGADTYTWNPSTGVTQINSNTYDIINPQNGATYTVTGLKNGCTGTTSVTLTVNPKPKLNATGKKTICEGESTEIELIGGHVYKWLPTADLPATSDSKVKLSPNKTTNYQIEIIDAKGCQNTETLTINVLPKPTVTVTAESLKVIQGYSTTLKASSTETSFKWLPAESLNKTDGNEVIATPNETTTYTVIVGKDCKQEATVTIVVEPYLYSLPNVFTPNGDGVNDVFSFAFDNPNVSSFEMNIYNRWGAKVFSTRQLDNFWDGKKGGTPVPEGAYMYHIKITRINGESIIRSGTVSILR